MIKIHGDFITNGEGGWTIQKDGTIIATVDKKLFLIKSDYEFLELQSEDDKIQILIRMRRD